MSQDDLDRHWALKTDTAETLKRVRRIEKILQLLCKKLLDVGKIEQAQGLSKEDWRELEHLVLSDLW